LLFDFFYLVVFGNTLMFLQSICLMAKCQPEMK